MEGKMGWYGQDTKKEQQREQGETSSIELQPRHKGHINPSRTAQDTQVSDTQNDIRPFVQITQPLPLYTSLRIYKRYNSLSELISAEYSYEPKLEGAWLNWIVWILAILGLAGSWSLKGGFCGTWWGWRWIWSGTIAIVLLLSCKVTSESVVAFPNLGIQLTSTTSLILPSLLPHLPPFLFRRKSINKFIPLSNLRTTSSIFLNEGFWRWSVVYYLGILTRSGDGEREDMSTHVVFPELRPRLDVLREVYYGLRETMFDDYHDE